MKVSKVVTKEGEVRYEVAGWTNGRGSKYVRRRFDRKVDADGFVTQHVIELAESETKPKALFTMAERTFAEEALFWMKHRGVEFSPGHKRRAKDALDKWILPEIGHLTLDKINQVVLSSFRIGRLEEGLKNATVNRETEVMMAILNYSLKQRRIPYHPAAGFQKLQENRDDMQFWEQEEASAFLRFTDAKYSVESGKRWIYGVYLLVLNTALRSGETWGHMPKDIKQADELLHVQRQWDRGLEDFRLPKGKEARYVPCNAPLRKELRGIIERDSLGPDQTVFRNEIGRPVDHDNFVGRCFEKDVVEAGVKRIRFHDLRHTAITLMIANGLDIKTVQEIAGHKDISTTMLYVHLLGDSVKKASRTFSVLPVTKDAAKPATSEVNGIQPKSAANGETSAA